MTSQPQRQLSQTDAVAAYDAFGEAVKIDLARYSVRICGIKAGEPCDPGTGNGLRVGSRNFISTAAHVVKDYDAESLWLLKSDGWMEKRVHPLRVGHRGGEKSDVVDVAYIEVDDAAIAQLKLECIGLERTTNAVARATNELVAIYGIPAKPDELRRRGIAGWDIFWRPFAAITVLEPPSKWHHGIDADREIEIDYPEFHAAPDQPQVRPGPEQSDMGVSA